VLFKEIDFKATRESAKKTLKTYRRLERMAGKSKVDLQAVTWSDMPKSPSVGNHEEDKIVSALNARYERDAIDYGISRLCLISRQILVLSYMQQDRLSVDDIIYKMGWGYTNKVTFNRYKNEALVEFADAYKNGELIKYSVLG